MYDCPKQDLESWRQMEDIENTWELSPRAWQVYKEA